MTASGPAFETPPSGLSDAEVRDRVERGLTNEAGDHTSRTYTEILRANILTRFNAILGAMLVVILAVGEIQDATFGIVLVANALIGIVQEIRAKKTLDRLAVLSAPQARVVRDAEVADVAVADVVLDDLCDLQTGDQVPADGLVRVSRGLEIDESLLTGEADAVAKDLGTSVLSGSFVVAGSGRFQATAVGADAYARRLAKEARRFTRARSEIVEGINVVLRLVQYALLPVSALLLWQQLRHHSAQEALTGTVAGVVGMVPEGLVLLTSVAFGLAALTLARRKVLVQELPAVEVLARVDVVCLDKTGTLTEGDVVYDGVEPFDERFEPAEVLGALAGDEYRNATLQAIADAFPPPDGWVPTGAVPFSSARKWSATSYEGRGTWVIGAPEMVVADPKAAARARADVLAAEGRRVLLLARTDLPLSAEQLPEGLEPAALVLLEERVRPDASETLRYFAEQGVELKVISGDNPRTVAAVARRVGLEGADDPIDARDLPEDQEALAEVLEQHRVFGRVTPQQKRAMVGALQSKGHVVAMTGDGVNDALALKDADIGIAMGSGAAATRAVAQIVLLDSRFSTMPGVVAEGRRVIANIERSSNLFVTKTVYAIFIAVAVVIAGWRFPLLPRQLTIVSTFTIGIPGFFLALGPNLRRYVPGFIRRTLRFTLPAGFIAGAAVIVVFGLARDSEELNVKESRTMATLVLVSAGLWVLVLVARPLTRWRALLTGAMVGAVAVIFAVPGLRDFYALDVPGFRAVGITALVGFGAIVALEIQWRASQLIGGRNPTEPRRRAPGVDATRDG